MDRFNSQALPPTQQAAFEALRQRFAAGLASRWNDLCTAQPGQRAGHLHRLAGAAGSFGLATLSLAAREAEQAADACVNGVSGAHGVNTAIGEKGDIGNPQRWQVAWRRVYAELILALPDAAHQRMLAPLPVLDRDWTQSDNTPNAPPGFNGEQPQVEAVPWKSAVELKPTTCS